MNEIWEQSLAIIRRELEPDRYEKWFTKEYIPRVEQRGRFFYICASDAITKNALNTVFIDLIEDTLRLVSADDTLQVMILDLQTESVPDWDTINAQPTSIPDKPPVFNPRYTFNTFVVGESNRFAHAAAMAVAESPARTYNPLFIYGDSGLGKTHLMHAIGQSVQHKDASARVIYVSSEVFTNEFVSMVQKGQMEGFKNRYRSADILLIDDIQFLSGKSGTQTEFFHTFNALHDAGKQIVISSDCHPRELKPLEERLRSRFEWGLITDIQPPDLETRCAILQQKAINDDMVMDPGVAFFIAERMQANIRELEGALNKVICFAKLNRADHITETLAAQALRGLLPERESSNLTVSLIQKTIADYYNVTVEDLKSSKKDRKITVPRQVAMYLSRELVGATLPQIGRDFGDRDHTTVMYACNKITADRAKDSQLDRALKDLTKLLKG